jgi:predicted lipoprotein with Yx(FWY)xxD motif
MRRAVLLAAALALAGAAPAAAEGRNAIGVLHSRYGPVIANGRGFVLYTFGRDGRGRSRCAGACAKRWPPFVVPRRPAALRGVRRGLIGVGRRAAGRRQATYAGRPLYFYVGDTRPGLILCQDVAEFGGLWLVQRPGGAPVR